jgi:hypothetical protein
MNPKTFISYSWTSPEHEARVMQLANHLVESGVDVVIDKWNLREGHDAHAFMEQMVTNPEIKKVLLVCDQAYAAKADGRRGGVGTETQIITADIYGKEAQDKFVALVFERSDTGPFLPTYYRSRIYIDFSDPATEGESFDRLLRWIYDQPLHVKPQLGTKPEFLREHAAGGLVLGTATYQRRAIEAAKADRTNAEAILTEYLSTLATGLEKLRITPDPEKAFDDQVVESIDEFLSYRDEFIEVIQTYSLYRATEASQRALHRFFESLIPYLSRPEHVTTWNEEDYDNFKFIVHELFLYAVAISLKHERFEAASSLMHDYFVGGHSEHGENSMAPFRIFRDYMRSLERRNQRLKLGRVSLRADMLKARSQNSGVPFRYLAEADFALFIQDSLNSTDEWHIWFPETLLHLARSSAPFEIFARSISAAYFDRMKKLLGVEDKQPLLKLADEFRNGKRNVPRWQSTFSSVNPIPLMRADLIATKP